jgi:hypothetical protein
MAVSEEKPATSFAVEHARRLGFHVPEFQSRFTSVIEMASKGLRPHRPKIERKYARTGKLEAERRVRQQERQAWKQFERDKTAQENL